MKMTLIIILIPIFVFCQDQGNSNDSLSISGQIILENNDEISKNRIALLTNLNSSNKVTTVPFELGANGAFLIKNLTEGEYKLIFRVNEDYRLLDTIIQVSPQNRMNSLNLFPTKKPCGYDADKDIDESSIKILVASGTSPSMNSKKDNRFEKKYNLTYVIFGDAREESALCLSNYNMKIFEFLDNNYGKGWRTKVRKDAIGFNELIKSE